MDKGKLEQRLKWIEESTNDFIKQFDEIKKTFNIEFTDDTDRILSDILIACDLNDNEPEKHWDVK